MDVKRVLVVEDEPMLRELLSTLVEDFGAHAMAVDTAERGICLLTGDNWAGVITDVRTPGNADGWDLAWAAYDHHPNMPVIVTSGGNNNFEKSLPPSATFIPKPWSLEQLSELVRQHFACS